MKMKYDCVVAQTRNRRQLMKFMTPEKREMVMKRLFEDAVNGVPYAMKLLFDHVFGKPLQAVQLTGENGGAVKLEPSHHFDHDAFRDAFSQYVNGRLSADGHAAPAANGN
jgi:hypothetical protein